MVQIIVGTTKKPVQTQSTVSQPTTQPSPPPFVKKPDGRVVAVSPTVQKITPPEETKKEPMGPVYIPPEQQPMGPQYIPPDQRTQTATEFILRTHQDIIKTRGELEGTRQEQITGLKTYFHGLIEAKKFYHTTKEEIQTHPEGSLYTLKGDATGKTYTKAELLTKYTEMEKHLNLYAVTGAKQAFWNIYGIRLAEKQLAHAEQDLFSFSRSIPYPGITTVKKEDDVYKVDLRQQDVMRHIYGKDRPDLYVAKHMQDWGIPAAIAGVATVTGADPGAWDRLQERYAGEIVGMTRRSDESYLDYTKRFWTSEQAITNVYLPLATIGVGYAVKPYMIGVKTLSETGRLSRIAATGSSIYQQYSLPIKIGLASAVTIPVAYSLYRSPGDYPLILGRTTATLGKMAAGFTIGGKLYTATHKDIITASHWTGTSYEQGIIEMHHQRAVLESQYHRPFEWGHPSTHYTAMLKPTMDRFPYVPITPEKLHVTTRGFVDPGGDPTASFILRRPTVSSRTYSYEVSHPSVEKGVDITYGRLFTKQGFTRDISGYGYTRYVTDIKDIVVYRTIGKTLGESTFYRGTAITKTIPSGMTTTPGRYGLMSVKKPYDTTYLLSRSVSPYYEVYERGKFYRMIPQTRDYFGAGGSMGLDTTGVSQTTVSQQIHLPGGVSSQLMRTKGYTGHFPKMTTRGHHLVLRDMEYGARASTYWRSSMPQMMQRTMPLSMSLFYTPQLHSLSTYQHQIQRQTPVSLSGVTQASASIQSSHLMQQQLSLQLSKMEYQLILPLVTTAGYTMTTPSYQHQHVTPTPYLPEYKPPSPPPPAPGVFFDLPSLHGRGFRGWDWALFGKQKRFRMRLTFDPFKDLIHGGFAW